MVVEDEQEVEEVDDDESSEDDGSSSLGSSVKSVISEIVVLRSSKLENSSSTPSSISDLTLFRPSSIQVTAFTKSERRFPPLLHEPDDPSELGSILFRRFYRLISDGGSDE